MTKILELPKTKAPEEMTDTEMEVALYNCTGCGQEPKENEMLCGIKLVENIGFVVFPPEQLCPSCLKNRMDDYKEHFKTVA